MSSQGLRVRKASEKIPENEDNKGKSTSEKVQNTLTEELIIGVCSPIGSMRDPVISEIKNLLETEYNYKVIVFKLSKFIEDLQGLEYKSVTGETEAFSTLMWKIKKGNELRKKYGQSVLTEIAIKEINIDRFKFSGINIEGPIDPTKIKSQRICYIFDSLKNKEELKVLRSIYKELFYLFGIFSPETERLKTLTDKGLSIPESELIIDTDDFEDDNHGQNVRNTFIESDFFIRASEKNTTELKFKIARYFNLIFNSEVVTPYKHEIAMYEAKSAAGNSACLSRQVGAAITNSDGDIISRGWNDVPKFGGNLYNADEEKTDHRCWKMNYCSNDKTKDELTENIIKNILNNVKLKELHDFNQMENKDAFFEEIKEVIRKTTKIKDLIEFSRSVHAEMHAIIVGSQLSGAKMIKGKLFCTTYPCHNCARHIIVAGIQEIYYIEPYVKSLCIKLHEDAITEDETEMKKVRILVYDGVAPRRYLEFFTMSNERKYSSGEKKVSDLTSVVPKTRLTLQALTSLENQAILSLNAAGVLTKGKKSS